MRAYVSVALEQVLHWRDETGLSIRYVCRYDDVTFKFLL